MPSQSGLSRLLVAVVALLGGVLADAGSAFCFVVLHSNWKRLAWVTPDAESTAPYRFFEGLIPIAVSVGWAGLILHARGHQRWLAPTAALAALEIALLAFALLPVARAGNGGLWATNVGLPALAVVALAGPIASGAWPMKSRLNNVWPHVAAGVVLPVAVYVAYVSMVSALGGV